MGTLTGRASTAEEPAEDDGNTQDNEEPHDSHNDADNHSALSKGAAKKTEDMSSAYNTMKRVCATLKQPKWDRPVNLCSS